MANRNSGQFNIDDYEDELWEDEEYSQDDYSKNMNDLSDEEYEQEFFREFDNKTTNKSSAKNSRNNSESVYRSRKKNSGNNKINRNTRNNNDKNNKNHSSRNNNRNDNKTDHKNDALQKKLEIYRKQLIAHRLILFLILFAVALVIIIKLFDGRVKGTPLNTAVMVDEKMNFKVDESVSGLPEEFPTMHAFIEDNYLRYLNKAYILFGTYPDCEYYKISPNVARNEFNWSEDFYVNNDGLYYSYFKDGEDKGRVGIDVSEFQLDIDWEKVKAAGIKVAMIRVGYRGYGTGEIHEDKLADTNMAGATGAGLDVGVYFFSSAVNREEGIEEAKYTLEKIKGYDIKQPIVVDTEYVFEDEGARSNVISVEDRTAAVVGFCETIEEAGYTPMVYASRDHFIKYLDIDAIGKWDFWLAAYDTPVFPYHTEGYQYSPYGFVDGITTQVDLDVWMR